MLSSGWQGLNPFSDHFGKGSIPNGFSLLVTTAFIGNERYNVLPAVILISKIGKQLIAVPAPVKANR
jgi:hypothetical protein